MSQYRSLTDELAEEMMSIPGVRMVTVAGFLAEVGNLSNYQHPRQIQKLAGLNLKENSSGQYKGGD
ncbi:IS110 family transposase [Natranaerobius trueperi]|uniref:IS110 family transposase n=1 Tax=Natranaerobius trueperi TaxID=759412 RepID=UPI001F0B325D|nr:IS110 family transposase [Natranaerobius trueperi]